MLGQRRRRWPNIKTALGECLVLAGKVNSDLTLPKTGTLKATFKDATRFG